MYFICVYFSLMLFSWFLSRLFHAWCLEHLCFTKSMCCIIQMGENTILSLEKVGVVTEGSNIIWVAVDSIWSWEVTDLCYAEFTVANLFIKKAWFDFMWMNICFTTDNVMMYATSVIKCLAQDWSCSVHRPLWKGPAWFNSCLWLCFFFLCLLSCFLLLLLFIFCHIFIRHPMYCTLMILSISGLGHHHVIYLLLWSSIGWWLVTYIIGLISGKILSFNIGTIQFSCFS